LVEKAGLPEWLALAVEHGAIDQERNGTSVTLSTSPYAPIALIEGGDTAETFERFGFWRRIGLSATGQIDDGSGNDPDELEFEDLSSFALKFRILGDRSSRNPEFTKLWNEHFEESVDHILANETLAFSEVFDALSDANVDVEERAIEKLTHG
jgi:hypothetical protein